MKLADEYNSMSEKIGAKKDLSKLPTKGEVLSVTGEDSKNEFDTVKVHVIVDGKMHMWGTSLKAFKKKFKKGLKEKTKVKIKWDQNLSSVFIGDVSV